MKVQLEVFMTFLVALFQTVVKMLIIAAVAFGGILLGKYLRKKKDEKDEE
jgi:hypothetical protein